MDISKQNGNWKNYCLAVLQGKNNKFTAGYGGLKSWPKGGVGGEVVDVRLGEMEIISLLCCLK